MPSAAPRLRNDLKISLQEGAGPDSYVIEDPLRNRFYKIGEREYRFLCLLESGVSPQLLSTTQLSEEEAAAIIEWFGVNQLLEKQAEEVMRGLEQLENQRKQKSLLSRLNLISFRVPLFNPDPLLNRYGSFISWLAGPVFLVFWLAAGLTALSLLLTNWSSFVRQGDTFFAAHNLLLLGLVWVVLKFLHELSHAVACKRYGGGVYEFGVLFILFIPLTYIDATSSWKFSSRWQRIHVAVAGIYMELFIAFAAILYWATHPGTAAAGVAHSTVLIAGVSSLFFNANPLMRFDGYYVLSDLTNIPNLYGLGIAAIRAVSLRFWLGIAQPQQGQPSTPFILVYGVCVYCWRILILFSLGYLASQMFSGWGLLLTIAAAIGWIYQPVAGFVAKIPQYLLQNPALKKHFFLRFAVVATVAGGLLFGISIERTITVPAVVLFENHYSIRPETSGFVSSVLVLPGDEVETDELLILLENDELKSRIRAMGIETEIIDIRERQAHMQRHHGELQLLAEQRKIIEAQLNDLEKDRKGLQVVAPGGGRVVGRRLANLTGVFVQQGEELGTIISSDDIRLVLSVSQDDVRDVTGRTGEEVVVDMRSSGVHEFTGVIEKVAPTASKTLPHAALAANYGGPFDVAPAPKVAHGLALLRPRFTVTVTVPPAMNRTLLPGQKGLVRIQGAAQKPAVMLFAAIKKWFIDRHTSQ